MPTVPTRSIALVLAACAVGPFVSAQDADSGELDPRGAASTVDIASDAPAPRTYRTLTELLAIADGRYPGLAAGDAAIEAAEARLEEARVSPFMQFQLDLGATVVPNAAGTPIYTSSGQLGDLSSWGPAASVQFAGAVPLYTFGKIRATWAAAEAGIGAAERGRERTRAQLHFDLRRSYFGLSFALDVLQMISEGEGKLAQALASFDARVEEDDAEVEPMDRYRLAAALAEVRARKSQAELAAASALAALTTMTGLDSVSIADCPSEAVGAEVEDGDALADAVGVRPELRMLEAARDARRAEVALHRARYYPDLVLAFSAAYSTAPGVTDISNPFIADRANNRNLGFGLGVRWSLDFLGNRRRVVRARAQVAEIEAQLQEATLGAELEIRVARERLADSDRRISAWGDGERQTRQWFVAAAQGYQVGTVEPRALVEALKAYFAARLSRLEAVLDHNVALSQLERFSGRELVTPGAWEPTCE
jgi:outer membrane protein TolC